MKFKTLLKWNVAIGTIIVIAKYVLSKWNLDILAKTPYSTIMKMHDSFDRSRSHEIKLNKKVRFELDVQTLNLLKGQELESITAIFGVVGRSSKDLTAQFEAETKNGEKILLTPAVTDRNSKELAKLIRDANKFPIGLKDFPNTIKMDGIGINRIIRETGCKKLFFYPCIENGWKNDIVTDPNRIVHLTLGVLGSDKEGDRVHDGHKIPHGLVTAIYGEETWPYANFTWYGNSKT